MAIQATFGTTVSIDGAAIGEAISITPPQVKIATIQTTNLSSADSAHTFIAGYTDSGEVTIEANYEKAEFDAVVAAAELKAEVDVVITIPAPNSATITISGIITGYAISSIGTGDELIKASFTLKASGLLT